MVKKRGSRCASLHVKKIGFGRSSSTTDSSLLPIAMSLVEMVKPPIELANVNIKKKDWLSFSQLTRHT